MQFRIAYAVRILQTLTVPSDSGMSRPQKGLDHSVILISHNTQVSTLYMIIFQKPFRLLFSNVNTSYECFYLQLVFLCSFDDRRFKSVAGNG